MLKGPIHRLSILLSFFLVQSASFSSQNCHFIISDLAITHWTQHHALSSVWMDQDQVDSFNSFLSRSAHDGFRVHQIVIHDGNAYMSGRGFTGRMTTIIEPRADASANASPRERIQEREIPAWDFQIIVLNLKTTTVSTQIIPPVDGGRMVIVDNFLLVFSGRDLLIYNRSDLRLLRTYEGQGHPKGFAVLSPFNSHHVLYRVVPWGMGLDSDFFVRYDWSTNTEHYELTAQELNFLRNHRPRTDFAWPSVEDRGFQVKTVPDGRSLTCVISFSDGTPTHSVTPQTSPQVLSQLRQLYPGTSFEQLPIGLFGNLLLLEYGSVQNRQFFGQGRIQGLYLPDPN